MAFTDGGSMTSYIGGFSKAFMHGIDANSTAATFSNGVVIPEFAYFVFQMTFAMITPALIVGAFAERIKFSAVMLFILLWVTVIYFPIAHWVWYVPAPDDVASCRQGRSCRDRRRRQDCGRGQARPRSMPMLAGSSRRARSTSRAAPSCISMPASPAWSAP